MSPICRVQRLRPLPTLEQLAAMYPTPHDHRIWGQGHHDRVEATIALARCTIPTRLLMSVADLSCGNGDIARRIHTGTELDLHLGDLAVLPAELPGHHYQGSLSDTIELLPHVGTFVCSETIEHLDDPASTLRAIRRSAERLLLSTPLEAWDEGNPEHLWAWDQAFVELLLAGAGFEVVAFRELPTEAYRYGIWVAS